MSARTALITGGTSGIGKATAEVLHKRGYRVAVTGQRLESVARAREELPEEVLVLQADARSLTATDEVISEVGARFGSLTTLFLNAGVSRPMTLDTFDEAAYDEVFAVNTKGQFYTLAKALPLLSDGASVIVTVGIGATRSLTGNSVTAGSHGAFLGMIPTLALELAPRRIRINAVSPGFTDTPMTRASLREISDDAAAAMAAIAEKNPFGRLAESEDIARTVAYLASDDAAYVTGQEIMVAGAQGWLSDQAVGNRTHFYEHVRDTRVEPDCPRRRHDSAGHLEPGSGCKDAAHHRGSGVASQRLRLLPRDAHVRVVRTQWHVER
ncbi:SDR family oxidoreductase [Kibdelosporangium aridum]|uniref:SDR family oxidoreductase n=1 Tax=Kibdelosporangium aridum TaxID=2030 RepID=UPI0021ADDC5F|nr:SDR family oxidoreductase [Kibdelosporangium aridum]